MIIATVQPPATAGGSDSLPDLNSCSGAEVVVPPAVEPARNVIEHDRANVDVFGGVNVQAATEGHPESSIGSLAWPQRRVPDFALAYDSLAVSLSKSGRAREAVPFQERVISPAPGDPSFYFNYSLMWLMLRDFKRAQEQQQKLRALDPAMAERLATMIVKRQR